MKTTLKSILISGIILSGLLVSASLIYHPQEEEKWTVPESAKKVKSPIKSDAENLVLGKTLYAKHCKSCHGPLGKGDGPKAKELDDPCGDFTTAEFQAQTDGEMFYKTKTGRDDMPSFEKKVEDMEDIWTIIIFLRTLGE